MPADPLPLSDVDLILRNWQDKIQVFQTFNSWEPDRIAAVLPHLASTGETGEKMNALRDMGLAIIDSKLSQHVIATMQHLDQSASRLSRVGIVLSLIIGIAGIIVAVVAN